MSTTSGGDMQQDNSVTTVYNGDKTGTGHQRVSPPSSSNGDSGFDNSVNESSAGDAKLIIDVPDFSKNMETPRTGIDNPSFETDKTDLPKPLTNGHNGTVNQENGKYEKDKMAEAVNLELINMKPFAKSANGRGNGVPAKKKETSVNMNDTYDDYFIPVNEHKKYMRGGEKLYVTKDKRDMNQSKKPLVCWVFGLILLASAVIIAILASTGIIFNNDSPVESRNFMENEKIAGFGSHVGLHSSVSPPPPGLDSSTPFGPPTTDMSGIIVPRTLQGEIVIDNMQFTPDLANKSSTDFENLASSVESELKNALFKKQTINGASDSIHIKVMEFAPGSVVAKYRIGWEYKDDIESQDLIDADTLKARLDTYLRENNGHLYNYRVPIHSLRAEHVMDKCKTENGKCSHYCSYDYIILDFVCSCPSELTISENMKDCKRIYDNEDNIDEFTFSFNNHDPNHRDESFDTELEPGSESESKSEPEPEVQAELENKSKSEPNTENDANVEPKLETKAEPEPSSELEVKAEPEPSSEPEVKTEPEPSSEPESKVEPEPSSEPETKTEPEPSSGSEVKAESEPSSEPEGKAEPEPSSKPEVKAEPEPNSEPEVKAEPEPNSEPEVKAEPEPSSEPEVKAEPEPSSELNVKTEPEPNSEFSVKPEPEPSSEPNVKVEPEPNLEFSVKPEPEPSSEPNAKAEPEPNSEPNAKAEPEPSLKSEIITEPEPSSEPEVKTKVEPNIVPEVNSEPEPSSEPKTNAEPEPSSKPEVKAEPEPSPETNAEPEPNSKSSSTENFESLSDVDFGLELVSDEQNDKSFNSSSGEKSISSMEQTDREAKSHSDETFSQEIKPEITYSISTESEFDSKTESSSEMNSKLNESSEFSLGDLNFNDSEESTTIPTITENWLTSTQSSASGVPKLPSDLEVTEKENNSKEDEIKRESSTLMTIEPVFGAKPENKSINDLVLESNSKNPLDQSTEWPEKSVAENSTSKEDMSSSFKESSTELSEPTITPLITEQEPVKTIDPDLLDKKHPDDLSSLEKTKISDPTKKLQSLTSLDEQIASSPHVEVISTSTQVNTDNFNENNPADEEDSLDKITSQTYEENVPGNSNEDEKSSALDLYQKSEFKKNNKKTSKNPEFYLSDSGFTKRNKTKTEKENKRNNKPDFIDLMSDMTSSTKCEEGQFQCVNGTTKDGLYCIKTSSRCDTNKDCTDNSDEYDCAENACSGNFQCKSGECLQRNLVCNSIMDCADGSDEQSCDLWKCTADEKQCTGGQCLPASYFCDGKSDCNNHSDELQCNSACNGYQCSNGFCISNSLRCNGVNDCSGGEDEQNCECGADEFKCSTGSECIPKTQVCDSAVQCPDGSDEWQCMQLDGLQLLAKKEGETTARVCSTNWSDQWSSLVCQSLGFTETKTTNYRPAESAENATAVASYLKLKDDSTLNGSKSLTGFLEPTTTPCDTVEIKCSTKHLCGDFGGKDPLSMETWPSVVYLQNTKTHKSCTASLVKRNWLLSSYSCVHSTDKSLSADQWEAVSSKSRVANESSLTKRPVSRIISHPGVKFEKLRYFNDTVLVELDVPYDLSDELNTVCLPEKNADDKQPCVTAGWSYESPGVFKQFSRLLSDPLMGTDVCNSTKHFNGFLTDREICVAPGEMEANNMEIGSPLMCLAENGLWQLQGMLSYRGGYGQSFKPNLYNGIVDLVPWAENTIASGL